jgi:hypothetical protein
VERFFVARFLAGLRRLAGARLAVERFVVGRRDAPLRVDFFRVVRFAGMVSP